MREVRLSAGAGFVVVVCGDMMTMPGLPEDPAAARIDLADDGTILGLSWSAPTTAPAGRRPSVAELGAAADDVLLELEADRVVERRGSYSSSFFW